MDYNNEQRLFIALNFDKHKSPILVKRAFYKRFKKPNEKIEIPSNNTIYRIHENLLKKYRVDDLRKTRIQRIKTALTSDNLKAIENHYKEKSDSSLRRAELQLRENNVKISYSSVRRGLKSLKFHPYRITLSFDLRATDYQPRLNFCNWILCKVRENENFIKNIIFSDEATFCIDGSVNRWNCRYWSQENPHMIQNKKTFSEKVMVWACISIHGVIGLYFYPQKSRINQHLYTDNCLNSFFHQLESIDIENKNDFVFQHDNARPHITAKVQNHLRQKFGNNFIGVGGVTPWPARSPDLTIPDFFLWGYLKDKVYSHNIENVQQLQQYIEFEVQKINQNKELLKKVYQSFEHRIHLCIEKEGNFLNT